MLRRGEVSLGGQPDATLLARRVLFMTPAVEQSPTSGTHEKFK